MPFRAPHPARSESGPAPGIAGFESSPGRVRRSSPTPVGCWSWPAVWLVVLMCLAGSARGQGIDQTVLQRVKDATVYIKLKANGRLYSTGSGFVMKVTGDTILIMTNRHVAAPDASEMPNGAKPELSCVFRSGTPQEQEVPARLLAYDEREVRDLAVLEVKGARQPPTPILADATAAESEYFETMQAYALGFPLGGQIQQVAGNVKANPAITVNMMTISSLRRDEANRLARVQFAGSMIEGNSGGPVVDAKGRLVGVVVSRIRGEAVGFAIPPSVIAAFLAGDVGDVVAAELIGPAGKDTQIKLAVRLVDPLNKLKSVAIRFAKQPAPAESMKPDAKGLYPQLPNATTVPLALGGGVAGGQFPLPTATPEERKVVFQLVVTDALGRVMTTRPMNANLPDKPGRIAGLDQQARERVLTKWSCETNLGEGIKMSHAAGSTTIDLPAGVPLNNAPQYNLFNAPCALVRVGGDFVTGVEVANTFDPGSEGVVVPTGKKLPFSFQSAGLLIWQDEKNFVRFERNKKSDGRISVQNQILVEVYKGGREVAVHYLDVPEIPIALLAIRKGGSLRLLFALPNKQMVLFQEMLVDFKPDVFVGVAAANLSARAYQAKLVNFKLATLDGADIEPKPFKMARLVDSGVVKLPDGTMVIEGAGMRVVSPENAPAAPQTNMADFKGAWSDNRQLLWNNDKSGQALSLELPVEADGKYQIKAKFTLAPDYAIAKLDLDGKPLYNGQKINFYSKETRPTSMMTMGTFALGKGRRKLTITVFSKDPKSSGYHFGLDEIQLVPVK